MSSEHVPGLSVHHDPFSDPFEVAKKAAFEIAVATGIGHHDIAVMVGSGWAEAISAIGKTTEEIPAEEISGFTRAIDGHTGTIRSVLLPTSKRALVIGARAHLYHSGSVREVAHPIRVAAATGASTLILTNGSGGIRPAWETGTVVLIKDHINLTAASPIESSRFVDMKDAYSPRLRELAQSIDPALPEGVYVQVRGPQYETAAEVKMVRTMGADMIGMSSAIETIAARESNMEVLGISLITNQAIDISAISLSHKKVIAAGTEASQRLGNLLARITEQL